MTVEIVSPSMYNACSKNPKGDDTDGRTMRYEQR